MTRETFYGLDKVITNEKGNAIEIKLKLASEKHSRALGTVNIEEKTLYIKRQKSKHLLIKANAIGFNYSLIRDAKRFNKVLLMMDGEQYLIPNEHILEHGSFLWFKNEGFEKQIFLNMNEIHKFTTHG